MPVSLFKFLKKFLKNGAKIYKYMIEYMRIKI